MTSMNEQQLISRIVDGEATEHDWQTFEASAERDQHLWRRLAMVQRDHLELSAELSRALSIADAVQLPNDEESFQPVAGRLVFNRFGAWTGWAVAALVSIVAWTHQAAIGPSSLRPVYDAPHTLNAGLPIQSAAEAFQAYLEKGRETGEVVGEIPERLLVESRPAVSGNGFEVIYVRQVMERTVVPDLYRIGGQDEVGRPTLVRFTPQPGRSM